MSAFSASQRAALILQLSTGLKRTTVNGTTAEQHSIADILRALQYDDASIAKENKSLGARFHSLNPPAAVRGAAS